MATTAGRNAGLYDGIIVTAAASHVPPPLVRQLKPGGRMVIPIGRTVSRSAPAAGGEAADGDRRQRGRSFRCGSFRSPVVTERGESARARRYRLPSTRARPPLFAVSLLSAAALALRSAAHASVLDHPVASLRVHDDQRGAARLRRRRERRRAAAGALAAALGAACSSFARRCSAYSRSPVSCWRSGCPFNALAILWDLVSSRCYLLLIYVLLFVPFFLRGDRDLRDIHAFRVRSCRASTASTSSVPRRVALGDRRAVPGSSDDCGQARRCARRRRCADRRVCASGAASMWCASRCSRSPPASSHCRQAG